MNTNSVYMIVVRQMIMNRNSQESAVTRLTPSTHVN